MVTWLLSELLAGGTKGFIRWAVRAMKTAGWIPGGQVTHLATSALGGALAAASTRGVGHATIRLMESGLHSNLDELRGIFDTFAMKSAGAADDDE